MLTRMPCAGEFDGRRLRDTFHRVFAADTHRRGRAADVIGMEVRDQNDVDFFGRVACAAEARQAPESTRQAFFTPVLNLALPRL